MASTLVVPCQAQLAFLYCRSGRGVNTTSTQVFKNAHLYTGMVGRKKSQLSWKCRVEDLGSETGVVDSEKVSAAEANSPTVDGRIAEGADLGSILEWQLDFCSRPILDDRGKKLWELIICDDKRQLEFARFYPNNVINSMTLKNAITEVIDTYDLPKPATVRFFRTQVKNIITKACIELGIQAVPSQKCLSLIEWLQERYTQVYSQHPGFQKDTAPISVHDFNLPEEVPENVRGKQWVFVQLPYQALQEEMKLVKESSNLTNASLDNLLEPPSPDTIIPGVAISSPNARSIAAWANAMELSSLDVDKEKSSLILSAGGKRWICATYKKTKKTKAEAEGWEAAKEACGGLHFLAIQPTFEEPCAGLWLMYNFPKSPV